MSQLPVVVMTERLRLALWTSDEAADIAAGRHRPQWHPDYPRRDERDAASLWRLDDPWGPRHIWRGSTVLGSIGFFGPPDLTAQAPEAQIGYGLVTEAHGWGFATEALRALLAESDLLGVTIRASVRPDNRASIRVLAKCRFTELRGADEEGNLVMARPLPAGPDGG